MKYAIKKGNKYFTKKGGWSKDIFKADLVDYKTACNEIKDYPNLFKNCKPVPIKETYTREEVKE